MHDVICSATVAVCAASVSKTNFPPGIMMLILASSSWSSSAFLLFRAAWSSIKEADWLWNALKFFGLIEKRFSVGGCQDSWLAVGGVQLPCRVIARVVSALGERKFRLLCETVAFLLCSA